MNLIEILMDTFFPVEEEEEYVPPELQRRIDRDKMLRDVQFTLRHELGREPTPAEIWREAPPE